MGLAFRATGAALAVLVLAAAAAASDGPAPLVVLGNDVTAGGAKVAAVTFVDSESYGVLGSVALGPAPEGVAFGPDERYLYVLHAGMDAEGKPTAARIVSVVDVAQRRRTAAFELGPALDGVFTAGGSRVLLVRPNRAAIFNTTDGALLHEVPLMADARSVQLSADGRRLYALDPGRRAKDPAQQRPGAVVVVDLERREVASTIAVPGEPSSLLTLPGGKGLLVVCGASLVQVDPDSGKEVRRVELEKRDMQWQDVLVSADGRHAYALEGFSGHDLYVADLEGTRPTRRVKVADTRIFANTRRDLQLRGGSSLLALSEDGRRLYAVSTASNTVAIIDTATHEVLAKVPGGGGVYSVVLAPDGGHAYLLSTDELTVIDTARAAVVRTQKLAGDLHQGFFFRRYGFRNMAFSPARRKAFFADAAGLHVLSLASGGETRVVGGIRSARFVVAPRGADVQGEAGRALRSHLDTAYRLQSEGKLAEAAEQYRQARVLLPGDDSLIEDIVRAFLQAGQLEAALQEMQRWARESPGDARRCWKVAALHLDRQRPREALPHIECALAGGASAGVPEAFLHLEMAKALMATGDTAGAREHATQAQALGDPRADRLLKQLGKER